MNRIRVIPALYVLRVLRVPRVVYVLCVLCALAVAGGCATFSPDGGMNAVNELTQARGQPNVTWQRNAEDSQAARKATRALLENPLTADDAVRVALLNNRALQAALTELGIAEADVVQAGRLRNPGFSFSRLTRDGELEIGRAFLFDVLGLITMPLRSDLEKRRFALTQSRAAADVLQLAADTRRAWVGAVAAQESVAYREQVKQAADAGAALAGRMAAAGNFNKLDQAREQVFFADAVAQLARAQQVALAQRERLTRLMGLSGADTAYQIAARLPDLPRSRREFEENGSLDKLEQQALNQRLDVQGALQEAENLAATLGLVRTTGFVNVLEAGYQRNSETNRPRQSGYEIELRLPLFDWGGAKVARAEYLYSQAVHRAADVAVRARSEVREAHALNRAAYDLATHYRDEIVPLRKNISEEVLLRYNGMLMSVFELLADARQQIAAVSGYIDAKRDFWLAQTALDLAMTGLSPGAMALPPAGSQNTGASAPAH